MEPTVATAFLADLARMVSFGSTRMKKIALVLAAAAGLVAVAACHQNPQAAAIENNADMVADNIDNMASNYSSMADNTSNAMSANMLDSAASNMHDTADNVRSAADQVTDNMH